MSNFSHVRCARCALLARSMQTPITIVNPVMGVWPKDAPDQQEEITMKFVAGTDGAVSDGSFRS